jgi:hypothetical protein
LSEDRLDKIFDKLFQNPLKNLEILKSLSNPKKKFFQWTPEEISQQLTLMTHEFYMTITRNELSRYEGVTKQDLVVNINDYLNFSGTVFGMVMNLIIFDDTKTMNFRYEFLSSIAEYLMKQNNIESLECFHGAFQSASVFRLLSDLETKKTIKISNSMKELFDMSSSFRNLRRHQENISLGIPVLGVTLTEMDFITRGNVDHPDIINWKKLQIRYKSICSYLKHQEFSYKFKKNPELFQVIKENLTSTNDIPDENYYQQSLKIKPRK